MNSKAIGLRFGVLLAGILCAAVLYCLRRRENGGSGGR